MTVSIASASKLSNASRVQLEEPRPQIQTSPAAEIAAVNTSDATIEVTRTDKDVLDDDELVAPKLKISSSVSASAAKLRIPDELGAPEDAVADDDVEAVSTPKSVLRGTQQIQEAMTSGGAIPLPPAIVVPKAPPAKTALVLLTACKLPAALVIPVPLVRADKIRAAAVNAAAPNADSLLPAADVADDDDPCAEDGPLELP